MVWGQSKAESIFVEHLELDPGRCCRASARKSRLMIEVKTLIAGQGELHCKDMIGETLIDTRPIGTCNHLSRDFFIRRQLVFANHLHSFSTSD